MAAITDVTILNNDNSKKFLFRACAPLDFDREQPAIAVPFVNTKPENNVLFRFTGQTDTHEFEFALFDDGTDVADGTHTSTVTTVDEQIDYLKNHIYTEDYDVDWTLTDRYESGGISGVIERLHLSNPEGGVTIVTGRLSFKPGRIGAL